MESFLYLVKFGYCQPERLVIQRQVIKFVELLY